MEQQQHTDPQESAAPLQEDLQSTLNTSEALSAEEQGGAADTAPLDKEVVRIVPKKSRSHVLLLRLCAVAIMTALAVIFCRLLGFPQSGIWRVEISFLPIAFVAFLWGPVWAGASYGTADLIGAALFTGVNPFITLEKIFSGVIMGIFFRRGRSDRIRIGIPRILSAFTVIAVFGDFLMMAFIFKFAFGYTWSAALLVRGVNALVNLVMRILLMTLCDLRLTTRLLHEGEKYGV